MKFALTGWALLCVVVMGQVPVAAAKAENPYWASINATRAMMRAGPGRNFPVLWEYRRQELPVKVIQSYQDWRKVIDPDGATGWLETHLLSLTRTAIVRGGEPRELHESADASAAVIWRVEAGVVGRVSQCANGWCKFDVHGRNGFVETGALWGAE